MRSAAEKERLARLVQQAVFPGLQSDARRDEALATELEILDPLYNLRSSTQHAVSARIAAILLQ